MIVNIIAGLLALCTGHAAYESFSIEEERMGGLLAVTCVFLIYIAATA